jgi:hypothetical protein
MEIAALAEQLDALTDKYSELREKSDYDELSSTDPATKREISELCTRTQAAAARLLPADSTYRREADHLIERYRRPRGSIGNPGGLTLELLGVLRAFRTDAEAGYLAELEASINAGVFADFLEMAEHALAEVHKTAAAVVAGFTLEEHLRKMCARVGITVTQQDGTPKKADALNAELAKAGAYGQAAKTETKDVTAWLGRRNDAAHGHHDRYTDEQVGLMIEGVRGFISRHPA